MEEEELKLLNEIDQLHKKLLSEPTGTFNFALKQVIPPNGYTYVRCAISLRDKVVELCNKFKPDYIEGIEIRQLYHTCGKEVSYVELQQGKVSKPRNRSVVCINAVRQIAATCLHHWLNPSVYPRGTLNIYRLPTAI